jgi:hypothetical protein
MQRLRRLALVGAIILGGLFGAPSASAQAAPLHLAEVVHGGGHAVAAIDVLAQAEPPTTAAPPPPIDVTPSSEGMPGAPLLHKLLSWLAQLALWGSLASILAGATVYGIAQNAANYNGAYRGKQLAVAGAIGAALAGLAPTAITMLYQAAGGR